MEAVSDEVRAILGRVSGGEDLALHEMARVIGSIMQGEWSDRDIALFLNALRHKGETVEEIAGAAAALRQQMTPIRTHHKVLIDTCGTGGDGSETFNISTAAAIVTAAAGVPVAKHGNRAITSKSGSADVLTELGVAVDADVETVEMCLDELGICFCFAARLHRSMKQVAAARKQLGVSTIFNMIGPLCNPASAPFQLLGAGRADLRQRLASALALLGTKRSLVVCGGDGLDEVTLNGVTHVSEVAGERVAEFDWRPADFGFSECELRSLQAAGPSASAEMIRGILAGRPGPPREIVVLNAAAALWTAGCSASLLECAQQASAAIDSGAASRLLANLAEASHR
jgi:anthranilate phosphoribosyltransferase